MDIAAHYDAYWINTKSLLGELYAGRISFGEVSKQRLTMEREYTTKIQLAIQAYNAQIDAFKAEQQQAEKMQKQMEEGNLQREARRRQLEAQQAEQLAAQRRYYEAQQAAQLEAMNQAKIAEEKREAQRRADANFAQGLQLLQMARPQFPATMPNNSFNCRSSTFGGVVTTNCN